MALPSSQFSTLDSDVIFALSFLKKRLGLDRQKRTNKLRQLLEGMPDEWLDDVVVLAPKIQAARHQNKG